MVTTQQTQSLLTAGRRLVTLCCVLVALSACIPDSATVKPTNTGSQVGKDLAAGRYDKAARSYERLAAGATSSAQRDEYLLDASRAWFNHGESMKALGTLRKVRGAFPTDDPIIGMLLATDKMISGQARSALNDLNRLRAKVNQPQLPAFLELKARAQTMTGDATGIIETLSEREAWLRRRGDIDQNRRLIWLALRDLGRKGHALKTPVGANRNTQGWLALARLYRDNRRNQAALNVQLRAWKQDYGKHMAAALTTNLGDNKFADAVGGQPESVALLLPLTGRFGGPGVAIRDGFISAYLNDAGNESRPQVQIYDTSAMPAVDAYKQAIDNGADFIVGPLSKSNVNSLIESRTVSTTTLALNYLGEGTAVPVNFFQFSLSPEHESAAIARHALSEGMMLSVAMVPETSMGERLLASFAAEFEAGGGKMIDAGRYNPAEKDFAMPITNLLNLNSSKARHQQLSAVVGEKLEFEPRRRQDAQFIFLVAGAKEGRLIRPQLNYHYANDLPVLSTSSIYENDVSRNRKDLDGVTFADTPWVVSANQDIINQRTALSNAWPQRIKRFGRLYAMGMDAYGLLPELHGKQQVLTEGYDGLTGRLALAPGNRVTRDLDIATISGGAAQYVPPVTDIDELPEQIEGGQ
ncbi:MAG: penicillin-binding protein activator [Gammaproteobacteria bacterium]